jgi:nicotinamide riboside kinase
LAYPDLPWQDDPQREHPNQRMELYQRYLTALQLAKRSFTIVKGLGQERTKCVIDAVDRALKHNRYQMPGR